MTIDEAIRRINDHIDVHQIWRYPHIKLWEALRMAISALRAQQQDQKNDPLTLEELREMDGDKIYIHYIDGFYADEDGAYFGKFEQLVRECEGKLTACELPLKYYGKTWLAYRHKPEEDPV